MLSGNNQATLDEDLIVCPISGMLMRHPVIASDGAHYELASLYNHFKRRKEEDSPNPFVSPRSGEAITSVVSDLFLKSTLDNNFNDDSERHEEYDEKEMLASIKADLLAQQNQVQVELVSLWQSEVKKSIARLGIMCVAAFALIRINKNNRLEMSDDNWSDDLLVLTAMALLIWMASPSDLLINNNRHTLFNRANRNEPDVVGEAVADNLVIREALHML